MFKRSIDIRRVTVAAWLLPSGLRFLARINGRLRGLWIKVRLGADGASVGKRLSACRGVQIVTVPGAKWHIGDRVGLGAGVILSVSSGATLNIGDDVRIMHYTLIGAEQSISIEHRAQIAEHCSIRDHDHDVAALSMHAASPVCSPVVIGRDSWIGCGVAVLRGSCIGSGAVIGANAVVRGEIPQNAVAVGIPARVTRMRQ